MPCLTTKLPNLRASGPVVQVVITPSSAFLKHLKDTNSPEFEKYRRGVQAMLLVDTGASSTVIGSNVVKILELKHHGTTSVMTPSPEAHEALTYDVDLHFPIPNNNPITFSNLEVVESTGLERQGIDGLIGRDILSNILLVYHGYTGEFTVAL